jgi:translation initiation factor 3 subunit F
VHITVDTTLTASGEGLGVKGWVSTALGLNPKPENCAFLPVPVTIKYSDSERPARESSVAHSHRPFFTPSLHNSIDSINDPSLPAQA